MGQTTGQQIDANIAKAQQSRADRQKYVNKWRKQKERYEKEQAQQSRSPNPTNTPNNVSLQQESANPPKQDEESERKLSTNDDIKTPSENVTINYYGFIINVSKPPQSQ